MRRMSILLILGWLIAWGLHPAGQAASQEPPYTILWAGDTLLADAAQPLLDAHGYQWPFEHLVPLLDAEYAILNAEGPITHRSTPYDPAQRWSYNAHPLAAAALAEVGFDALGFSNNHTMDRGAEGITDTIRYAEAAGMAVFGAGTTRIAAEQPLLIDTPYGRVGVVALGLDWGADRIATATHPGTVAFSVAAIQRGHTIAVQGGAQWVVAYVHWGQNYDVVRPQEQAWAQTFVDAGYDMVIGHGAHVVQPIALIDGVPVVYSLGNFVFGTAGRFTDLFPGYGLIVTAALDEGGFYEMRLRCIQTDNDVVAFQPRPCTIPQAEAVFGALHPAIKLTPDGGGVLRWRGE